MNANAHFDILNIFFCFCLSPPPVYFLKDNAHKNESIVANINWVKDQKISKEDFIKEKHGVSNIKIMSVRVLCGLVLFLLFYIFPFSLYILYTFISKSKKSVDDKFLLWNAIMSTLLVLLVIFYVKTNFLVKGIMNACFICTLVLFLILFIVNKIIFI